MARNTINYTVDSGRDKGKVFVLTEMDAFRAESWAARALLAVLKGGQLDLPDGFEKTGMAGMAELGLKALAGLSWEDAQPLLNEMLECVQIMPDPSKAYLSRPLIKEDIEDVSTLLKLRAEVWKLHVGFLQTVTPSA